MAGDAAITFNSDAAVREFVFSYTSDLSLSGLVSTDYIVTVIGEAGNDTPVQGSATFILTLKNPCIDPDFTTIQQVPLPVGEQYILHDYKTAGGYTFTHDPFLTVTTPIPNHGLCGSISYTATFEGAAIDTTTKPPMAYDTDTASRTFLIYSEDFGLLGDRTFTVAAFLSTYPTATKSPTPDASSTIKIINPCLDPFSLTSTP